MSPYHEKLYHIEVYYTSEYLNKKIPSKKYYIYIYTLILLDK
jgi:hypothetical protein